jgi:uncharacterized membrane protein
MRATFRSGNFLSRSVLQGKNGTFWLLAAVIGAGVLMRLDVLNQPMRYDEAYTTLHYVAQGIPTIISDYSAPNNHVLYNLLVSLSASLFGFTPAAVRLPAFLAGIACIPATYWLGSRRYNRSTGLVAASLVACSSALVEYSTNGRGYTLQCLLVLLLIGASLHLQSTGTRFLAWRWYMMISVVGLYLLPTTAFPIAALSIWLVVSARRLPQRSRFWSVWVVAHLIIGVATLVLYLPILLNSGAAAVVANPFVRPVENTEVLSNLMYTLVEWIMLLMRGIPFPLVLLFSLATLVGIYSQVRQQTPAASPLIVLFAVSLLGAVAARNGAFGRTWLYLLPPLFLLCAHGLHLIAERWRLRYAPVIFVIALLLITLLTGNAAVLASMQTGICPSAQSLAAAIARGEPVDDPLSPPCEVIVQFYQQLDGTYPAR